ncbi:hypothetical protein Moror_2926 [Moniliophthora roreri MCA 2997]|uniref:DUF6534 domain-containing protein n=1 Tax=Moniliophthora roreri (strain MCA 2997) TaxID=1381753 RepID=V2XEG9_MONRO|nr:hypothetical protein Moror_2926 [Moniliophthora roreri MCA 2997]
MNDLPHLAGPMILGYLLNWGLYGVLSVQVYIYWKAFPNDNLYSQALVYSLFLLETAQTIFLTHDAFQSLVFGFGKPDSLDIFHFLWLDTYLFDGLVALLVQTYYANRIRILLSGARVVPGVILLLSITQFFAAIVASQQIEKIERFSRYVDIPTPAPSLIWLGCAILADILIAVTMVYALSRYDTTFKETRNLVKRLTRLAMETCSLVVVTCLIQPLFYFVCPGRTYHVAPAIVVAKLYSNSLLALFNSRLSIHGARGTGSDRTGEETSWRTSIHVTANLDAPIPLSTPRSRAQLGSTFPSTLGDTDDSDSTPMKTMEKEPDGSRNCQ